MEKDINLYQKFLILCSKILVDVLHNMSIPFLLPWRHTGFPDIKGFACHLWHSVLIFANGASSSWFCKHLKMLGRVCGLGKCFSSLKSPKYWNQVGGDWKRVSCHGNQFLYSRRCVACRTISPPSFTGLCCKLPQTGLFIFSMFYWVE